MAKFWVQRRFDDGQFWQRNGIGYGPLESARAYEQWEVRKIGPAALGLEWVELDAAGQPVEATKAAEPRFVMRSPSGLYHMGCGDWTEHLGRAMTYAAKRSPLDPRNVMVPILVHPDGTVTLDEPAPAIAQPSPYSESADAPIALVPVDDVQLVAQTSEALGVLYHELARMTAEAAQLERQRDEAAARLRGGK